MSGYSETVHTRAGARHMIDPTHRAQIDDGFTALGTAVLEQALTDWAKYWKRTQKEGTDGRAGYELYQLTKWLESDAPLFWTSGRLDGKTLLAGVKKNLATMGRPFYRDAEIISPQNSSPVAIGASELYDRK